MTQKTSKPTIFPSTQICTLNYYHEQSSNCCRSSCCWSTKTSKTWHTNHSHTSCIKDMTHKSLTHTSCSYCTDTDSQLLYWHSLTATVPHMSTGGELLPTTEEHKWSDMTASSVQWHRSKARQEATQSAETETSDGNTKTDIVHCWRSFYSSLCISQTTKQYCTRAVLTSFAEWNI